MPFTQSTHNPEIPLRGRGSVSCNFQVVLAIQLFYNFQGERASGNFVDNDKGQEVNAKTYETIIKLSSEKATYNSSTLYYNTNCMHNNIISKRQLM